MTLISALRLWIQLQKIFAKNIILILIAYHFLQMYKTNFKTSCALFNSFFAVISKKSNVSCFQDFLHSSISKFISMVSALKSTFNTQNKKKFLNSDSVFFVPLTNSSIINSVGNDFKWWKKCVFQLMNTIHEIRTWFLIKSNGKTINIQLLSVTSLYITNSRNIK